MAKFVGIASAEGWAASYRDGKVLRIACWALSEDASGPGRVVGLVGDSANLIPAEIAGGDFQKYFWVGR